MTVAGQPGSARHVCSSFHGAWDRDLEPALEIEDGDVVELHVPDASRDQIGEQCRTRCTERGRQHTLQQTHRQDAGHP